MSSVPERSDSQRSYTKGDDDELSVRKINRSGKDVEGRASFVGSSRSEISSMISGDTHDLTQSCALKQFSKHRSSHLRFLAWVAYTRRYSNDAITNDERRTCPLLWCRTRFDDQDEMLQHVWNCPELNKGVYFCFHCKKSERMGKFHKRCTGAPSKTERLTNVAKKIFSKLGATSHRNSKRTSDSEGSFNLTSSWQPTDVKDPNLFRDSPTWDFAMEAQEMPDTSIPIEMAADWTAACQELADTSIMDMIGNDLDLGVSEALDTSSRQDNFYADMLGVYTATSPPPARKSTPKLSLDTSMSPLYRNEWKYPVKTYQPPPLQTSIPPVVNAISKEDLVSPMSAVGNSSLQMSLEVSPTDTIASGASFFTDSGYTSATSRGESSQCPSRVPSTKRTWDIPTIPEEHYSINEAVEKIMFPSTISDFETALTASLFSTPSVSRSSSSASAKGKANAKSPYPNGKDTDSLLRSLSEVLGEHITHTKTKLNELDPSPVVSDLLAVSKTSLVSIGLETLAGLLEDRKPKSILEVFAFAHIASACTISMATSIDPFSGDEWFQELLSYASCIPSETQQQTYLQIASSIWQPALSPSMPRSPSLPRKSNMLLKSCHRFLDALEYAENNSQLRNTYQSVVPAYDFEQMTFELKASSLVTHKLASLPTIEAFRDDIQYVDIKLHTPGMIRDSRELELELICAAKVSSQSEAAYSRFVDHVTTFCDDLRKTESGCVLSRTAHQLQHISLISRSIQNEVSQDESTLPDIEMSFDDQFFDFANASNSAEGELVADDHDGIAEELGTSTLQTNLDYSFLKDPLGTIFQDVPDLMENYPDLQAENMTFNQSQETASSFQSLQPPSYLPMSSETIPPAETAPIDILKQHSIGSLPFVHTSDKISPSQSPGRKREDDRYKCHCGFSPSGEEKWKASNLRRHKRTQHPPDSGKKEWKCQWPGCSSVFTRSDNLRSHQKTRSHGVLTGFSNEASASRSNPQSSASASASMADGRRTKKQRVDVSTVSAR